MSVLPTRYLPRRPEARVLQGVLPISDLGNHMLARAPSFGSTNLGRLAGVHELCADIVGRPGLEVSPVPFTSSKSIRGRATVGGYSGGLQWGAIAHGSGGL